MLSFNDLLLILDKPLKTKDFIKLYKISFKSLVRGTTPDQVLAHIDKITNNDLSKKDLIIVLLPLYCASIYRKPDFVLLYKILKKANLICSNPSFDYFNSLLLHYYYLCSKHLGRVDFNELLFLKIKNDAYKNRLSVNALINNILDYQICNNIYIPLSNYRDFVYDRENLCLYYFYSAFTFLVLGRYKKALNSFSEADILNKSKRLAITLKKLIIVNKLLLGSYEIEYKYHRELVPYFSLISHMKNGNLKAFNLLLEEKKQELFNLNIFYVVRRLKSKIILESIRRISTSYKRIGVIDISKILGVTVNSAIYKAIQEKMVKGKIEENIFILGEDKKQRIILGKEIRKVIEVRNNIEKLMEYKETPLLSEISIKEEN